MRAVGSLMVAVSVLTAGYQVHGQTNSVGWENDWAAFGAHISPYLSKVKVYGTPPGSGWYTPLPQDFKEVSDAVGARPVTWIGRVSEIVRKDGTASVSLRMPPQTIAVQPDHVAVLDSLHVTSTKDESASWAAITAGDWVRFRTTIKGNSIFAGVGFMMGLGNHAGEWSVIVSTEGGEAIEVVKNMSKELPSDLLPSYTEGIESAKGDKPVRVSNPNDFWVAAGVRSGKKGVNFIVPPEGAYTTFVPDGTYDIFFVYSSNPTALFQGDSFTLQGNGVEIKIVKVVDGNYGIRQVK